MEKFGCLNILIMKYIEVDENEDNSSNGSVKKIKKFPQKFVLKL